ncbi:MAG: response regulator [Rickettsiales bacterium]
MDKQTTVLIAEDNKLNLELFTDLLELKNAKVIQVVDCKKVISEAKKTKPDLIISDIRLGVFSGVELIKQIKDQKDLAGIPVIAITAYVTEDDRQALQKIGCDEYLSKPLPVDDFYKVVSKYIKI